MAFVAKVLFSKPEYTMRFTSFVIRNAPSSNSPEPTATELWENPGSSYRQALVDQGSCL